MIDRLVMISGAGFLWVIFKCDRAANERYIGLIPVIAAIELVTRFKPELGRVR
ncbi:MULTISPECIES: hypothetical protein [Aerosakkonema]|uniref:hypothetical protein n=1 Tax=Aerosakkonema TaxID=1246629 RepID=UPI0035B6E346